MNEREFQEKIKEPNGIYEVLRVMNTELNRLIQFAKNSNTFQGKIYPDLVNVSSDPGKKK